MLGTLVSETVTCAQEGPRRRVWQGQMQITVFGLGVRKSLSCGGFELQGMAGGCRTGNRGARQGLVTAAASLESKPQRPPGF